MVKNALEDGTVIKDLAMIIALDNIIIDRCSEIQNESVNESENSEENDSNAVSYNELESETQNSESNSNDNYISLSDDDNLDHQDI